MNDQPKKATRKARPMDSQQSEKAPLNTPDARASVRVAADSLRHLLTLFHDQLQAMTTEHNAGWRMVAGLSGGVALTQSRGEVFKGMRELEQALVEAHGHRVEPTTTPVNFMESDSPDGPWTPVPASKVTARTYQIGGAGADAMLCDALEGLAESLGFARKGNANGGAASRDTFNRHDLLSPIDLRRLESALKSLRLWCEQSPSTPLPARVGETDSASTDDAMRPALDESDCIVLHALKKLGQERLHSAHRIAKWLTDHKRDKQRSARTVSTSLKNLVRLGYAERSNGERRGARLTMKGLRAEDCCD
jgi:hypothetical protein